MNDIVSANDGGLGFLAPKNITEAMEMSKIIADSDFVPKDYQGKPGNIMVAMQLGGEVGLGPIQSLQTIAVINGRPAIYGDGMLALVQSSPLCEDFEEGFDDKSGTAWCRVKRVGRKDRISEFSMDDAKQAKLLGKQGPWSMYPKRMCQMRARSWALRDEFADVLKGMSKMRLADEIDIKDVTDQGTDEPHKQEPRKIRKFKTAEKVNTDTGEIIEADQAPDEAVLAAMAMIHESISTANNMNDLKTLKKEILELPQGCQADLVQLWNGRKKELEATA